MRCNQERVLSPTKKKNNTVSTVEIGSPGTQIFSGIITGEEYNTDLTGSAGRAIYEKMRRSDGTVSAAVRVCVLPLLRANWTVEPASEDKQDKLIAEHVQENLFGGMTITWESFLRQALTLMLSFGFSMFEKVYEVRDDNKYYYKKLAPRLPRTIYKWYVDDEGELTGIQQLTWKGESYEFIDIDAKYLVVFTNDKEGSNFEGSSLLRPAYQHWYYKSNMYRIDAVAAERHGVGLPVFKHPAGASQDDRDALDSIGKQLHSHERMYVRLANDYDFDIVGAGSGKVKDIIKSIEHHDQQISRSILAQFLTLGSDGTGSYALSRDQSSFFLMALQSVGANIRDTMDRYVIKPLVDLNYNVDHYPKLSHGSLETREIQKYAQAVSQMATSGIITPDLELENEVRTLWNLPERKEPEEVPEPVPEPVAPITPPIEKPPIVEPQDDDQQPVEPKPKAEQQNAEVAYSYADIVRPEVEAYVQFAEITKKLDSGIDTIVAATESVKKKQIGKLVEIASKLISSRNMEKLDDIDVPYKSELSAAIQGVTTDLFRYGRKQVKAELAKQKKETALKEEHILDPLDIEGEQQVKAFLRSRAKASSSTMAARLKATLTFESLQQMRQGVLDEELLTAKLTDLSDREVKKSAQASVSEAFNFGRSIQARKQSDEISRAIYSAVMDPGTCVECRKMDTKEWDFDDPKTDEYAAGNTKCEGNTYCRCVLIFVHKSEVKAAK